MICPPRRTAQALLCLAVLSAGCNRSGVRVSLEPRELPALPAPATEDSGPRPTAASQKPRPKFTWTLPAGWTETGPGQMSVASFKVQGNGNEGDASVSITPLPNMSGKEDAIVNMWRSQVGAPPLSDEEAAKALSPVDVGGEKGLLFDVSGTSDGKPFRIVTAMVNTPAASWFYKLSGDEALVAAQRPAFLEFLKSVHMQPQEQEQAPEGSNQANSKS